MAGSESINNALLIRDSHRVKTVRTVLEDQGFYSNACRIVKLSDGSFALPLSQAGIEYFSDLVCNQAPFPRTFDGCLLIKTEFPPSKKQLAKSHSEHQLLYNAVQHFLSQYNLRSGDKDELLSDLPMSWEKHGDLVLLPSTSFTHEKWSQFILSSHCGKDDDPIKYTTQAMQKGHNDIWITVASALKCKRLAIDNRVKCNEFRNSGATLLLGESRWVEHIDNGIKYVFDVTKVMFSSGNITEKLRVASFKCRGETVLDLYAGIGYFTLPYLVHAQAEVVHACEWNDDAVEALERGLEVNGVKEKCVIHCGDNRKLKLKNFADRVNLGLIPSSEEGWPIACAALKNSTGGWLHIHGNISTYRTTHVGNGEATCTCTMSHNSGEGDGGRQHGAERNPWEMREKVDPSGSGGHSIGGTCVTLCEQAGSRFTSATCTSPAKSKQEMWEEWSHYVAEKIHSLLDRENPLKDGGRQWRTRVRGLVHIKSYAPHVDHLVADVECRPVTSIL